MTRNDAAPNTGNRQTQKTEMQQKLDQFDRFLNGEKVVAQLARALPDAQNVKQEIELIKNTVRRTPKLLLCTRESLYAAVVQTFELGLKPLPALGHAYFIPFNNKGRMICQLIIGYRGLIELGRRSGVVSSIRAEVVRRGDYFRYRLGLNPELDHVPADVLEFEDSTKQQIARAMLAGKPAGQLIAAYSVVTFKDASKEFRVVTDQFIQRVRKMSRGADHPDSPWKNWEDQMWAKTAIRQTLKFVPLSPEDRLLRAIEVDEKAFVDVGKPYIDTTGVAAADNGAAGSGNGHGSAPEEPGLDTNSDETEQETRSGMDQYVEKTAGSNGVAHKETTGDTQPTQTTGSASSEPDVKTDEASTDVKQGDGDVPPSDPPVRRRRQRS